MSLPRSKVILLVEDNRDDEALTLRALQKSNIQNQVVVVRDGVEALDYLFSTSELPELVLLDLNLPRLDGIDVLRRLRECAATRRVPVVVLSSSKEHRDLLASYDSGANSFVQKKVDFSEFTEAVRQLGMYWLVLNEPPPGPAP